ncbi:MAG TPA: permease [Symbiobacteriaceae bacterium]|nr:permease [Symbiobacteriaceae bacterium]
MEFVMHLVLTSLERVWTTFTHNWWLLLISTLIAAYMKLYIDQAKVAAYLKRHERAGVLGATAVAVTTPLCSCGTTAVILGMMASTISWAPIVAFMVASPLSSPEELVYSAGLFGWPFAITFFVASILLGLAGGVAAYVLQKRGWLKDQARLRPIMGGSVDTVPVAAAAQAAPRPGALDYVREVYLVGRRLLVMFLGFAFIGYVLNGLIPESWVVSLFGGGHVYGVPLAATLGLPLYINSEASLPLVRSMMELGMSPGATMAFLITGAGTSIGAITGALTIARWRVVGLVVATLWIGAIVIGYAYNLFVSIGLV